jgi:hypothetical protein
MRRFDVRGTFLIANRRTAPWCRLETPVMVSGASLYILSAETEVLMEGLRALKSLLGC